jgi:hypothetical protein
MIQTVDLIHPRETLKISGEILTRKRTLLMDDPALAPFRCSVRAAVSVDDFCHLVLALEDKSVEVTNANFGSLSLLCDEFGFVVLSERLSVFRQSADIKEFAVSGAGIDGSDAHGRSRSAVADRGARWGTRGVRRFRP